MLASRSMRLREFTVHVERLALKEVPGRLAAYLIHLIDEQEDEKDIVFLNISKVQLSSLLGTTPETLSRILSEMADRGFIEVKGRDIMILDHAGLEQLAALGKKYGWMSSGHGPQRFFFKSLSARQPGPRRRSST